MNQDTQPTAPAATQTATPQTHPKTGKILATSIYIERAEGPTEQCFATLLEIGKHPPFPFSYFPVMTSAAALWCTADLIFQEHGKTAPGPGNGCHKCDVVIRFSDGGSFKTRFDLRKGGRSDGDLTLTQALIAECEIYCGRAIPDLTYYGVRDPDIQERFQTHVLPLWRKTGLAAKAERILDHYHIGV